jgi:cytochrome c-type biogenesis protein CcmH
VLAAAAATVALGLVIATIRGPSAPPSFSARVQEVAAGLRCVACQNLSVADSPSRMAAAMRSRIRAELRSRRTPDQIRAFFVSKYGPWILLSPRASGVGWVVWIAPPLALVLGGGVLLWALLRRARGDASDDGRVTPVERTRIRHDLAALEEPD